METRIFFTGNNWLPQTITEEFKDIIRQNISEYQHEVVTTVSIQIKEISHSIKFKPEIRSDYIFINIINYEEFEDVQ